MTSTNTGAYAEVNGLRMYYETHGEPDGQPPVVLIHGAFSATGTSWGALLGPLAATRQVISVELQGHGHTADIDRPLRTEHLAGDVAALLDAIGVERADLWGYSTGAAVALRVGLTRPEKVRKLVLQSIAINEAGYHPGHGEMMTDIEPEMLHGSPFHDEYLALAPNPDDFATLVAKVGDFIRNNTDVPTADIEAMDLPVLTIMGDSDIFRPEHAVELFRATGGGVNGDIVGMPASQLAILPGASHITSVHKVDLLMAIVPAFLDA